jgi:hypothetical protein
VVGLVNGYARELGMRDVVPNCLELVPDTGARIRLRSQDNARTEALLLQTVRCPVGGLARARKIVFSVPFIPADIALVSSQRRWVHPS